MQDRFSNRSLSVDGPATHGFAISPADGTDLSEITRALYVGASGSLALTLASGANITLTNVGAGVLLPLRAMRVLATGTTAASIVGLV